MTVSEDIDTIKDAVKHVLARSKRARRDDNYLTLRVLEALGYAQYNFSKNRFLLKIDEEDLQEMPALESIRRTRQKLQQKNMYQPSQETQIAREIEEKRMRQKMQTQA